MTAEDGPKEGVTGSTEHRIGKEDGFDKLPGLVPVEDLAALADEATRLEAAAIAANPVNRWLGRRSDEGDGLPDLKSQYKRTEIVQFAADPNFSRDYPVMARTIEELKRRSGKSRLDTLNVNRYRPQSQIAPHTDSESSEPFSIFSVEVADGNDAHGVFRVWPDLPTIGYASGEVADTTEVPLMPGDAVELKSIFARNLDGDPYVSYSVEPYDEPGGSPVDPVIGHYVTRLHSGENPSETEERTIILVALK